MTVYRAFGYEIQSDHPLHFSTNVLGSVVGQLHLRLTPNSYPKDVSGWHLLHQIEDYPGGPILSVRAKGERLAVDYAGWLAHYTRHTTDIEIESVGALIDFEHVAERVWLPLSVLWSNPDWLALHGSAVCWQDQAYVFVGQSGAGKSTTAYQLYHQGARLLSDDMVFVDVMSRRVFCGAPTLRLWQSAEDVVGAQARAQISPDSSKLWFEMSQQHPTAVSLPLKQVVVLTRHADASPEGEITSLDGLRGVLELLDNSFEWATPLPETSARRLHLARRLIHDGAPLRLRFATHEQGSPVHVKTIMSRVLS